MTYTSRNSIYDPTSMYNSTYYNDSKYAGRKPFSTYYGVDYQCVDYAVQRSCEIAGKAVCYYSGISTKDQIEKPLMNRSGYGNAIEWINDTLWEKGKTPKLGAIIVYGSSYGSGLGHVRVVEGINGNTITYSAANENGKMAFGTINTPTWSSWSSTSFQGYIYNPYAGTSPTPTTGYTVTLNVSPSGAGTCTGGGTYESGTEATLTAIPNTNYDFEKWSDGYTGNPRYWTITEDLTLTAYFKKKVAYKTTDITLENSITRKAVEVLYGKYGTGEARKKALGDDYLKVQYQVNYLIDKYSVYERLALQILIGLYGNGTKRKYAIIKAGYNYVRAQQFVAIMKKKTML